MKNERNNIDELLMSALKAELKDDLPYNFVPDLRRKMFPLPNTYKLALLRVASAIAASLLCLFCLYFMNPEATIQLITGLATFKYILLFLGVVFLMIQYVDWKLVRPDLGRK